MKKKGNVICLFILIFGMICQGCVKEKETNIENVQAELKNVTESSEENANSFDGTNDDSDMNQELSAQETEDSEIERNWLDCVRGSKETGYITEEKVKIETKHLVFEIDPDIYVPGDIVELADATCDAIEKVTGMLYDGGQYSDCKITVYVVKNNISAQGITRSELLVGDCAWTDHINICPGDLFLTGENALVHELVHTLESEYDGDRYAGQMLTEGFAEHASYLAVQYMEENNPELAVRFGQSENRLFQMEIENAGRVLYGEELSYWLDNGFDYAYNGLYAVGFRMMAYLEDCFGDYTRWIPYDSFDVFSLSTQEQLELIEEMYGDNAIEGFYDWLKSHEEQFAYCNEAPYDLTGAKKIDLFPTYSALDNRTILGQAMGTQVLYDDLEINLLPLTFYLKEYKEEDIEHLVLHVDSSCTVEVYDADGNLLSVHSGEREISLAGAGAVLLSGKGSTAIEITGYDQYTDENGSYRLLDFDPLEVKENKNLSTALTVATEGDTIKLVDNIEMSETCSLPEGIIIEVEENATFTLKDCLFCSGVINVLGDFVLDGGWVWWESGSEYHNDGITIKATLNSDYSGENESYSSSVKMDKRGDKYVFDYGFKCILDITLPEGDLFQDYFAIDEIGNGVVIRVNGEVVSW